MPDAESPCPHLASAANRTHGVHPDANGCSDCLATGGAWVHLRLCLTCGHVGCCDQSPNRHARQHSHETHHPVVRSFEPGEPWAYCFPHDTFVEELPAFEGEAAPRHFER
jgi:uncharacterized UBP type Zn finger protein